MGAERRVTQTPDRCAGRLAGVARESSRRLRAAMTICFRFPSSFRSTMPRHAGYVIPCWWRKICVPSFRGARRRLHSNDGTASIRRDRALVAQHPASARPVHGRASARMRESPPACADRALYRRDIIASPICSRALARHQGPGPGVIGCEIQVDSYDAYCKKAGIGPARSVHRRRASI